MPFNREATKRQAEARTLLEAILHRDKRKLGIPMVKDRTVQLANAQQLMQCMNRIFRKGATATSREEVRGM